MKYVIRGLLAFSFFITLLLPTSFPSAKALSTSLVIYQVQTAGAVSGTASQELIVLLNSSSNDIDVTNWCVQYSSSSDSPGFKKCFTPPDSQTQLWVSAGGLITLATSEFISANPSYVPDFTYSAGIAATGGHLRLFDVTNAEIDKVGWGTAIAPEGMVATVHVVGKVLGRTTIPPVFDTDNNVTDFTSQERLTNITSGLYEVVLPDDVCPNIDELQEVLPDSYMLDDDLNCQLDACPNIDDLQVVVPDGYEKVGDLCELIPLETRPILITELYPNAPSYDTGQEFIELYNPHDEAVDTAGYTMQIGPDFGDDLVFESFVIPAKSFKTISDTESGIVLPNSTGVNIRLRNAAGNIVSEVPVYSEMVDTTSWAIVDDEWIITNQITPGSENKPYLQAADDEVLGITTILAPCPAGKYRNPETNRCRTIESAVSTLTPCDEDEYRNPDTNRCRKVATTTSTLKPCDEGEERNPETNRCRKITSIEAKTIDELPGVTDVAVTESPGSFNWQVTTLALLGTGSYILYEWRNELLRKFRLFRNRA